MQPDKWLAQEHAYFVLVSVMKLCWKLGEPRCNYMQVIAHDFMVDVQLRA